MFLHIHSSMENDKDKLFWDLGANVNIINNINDFKRDSVLDIKFKRVHIIINAGSVTITFIGIVK